MTPDTARTDALRSILVDTVDAAPATRRPSRRVAAAAIAAFALAGAATGGAISAAALAGQAPVSDAVIESDSTELARSIIGPLATAQGQPFSAGSDGVTVIDLGVRPPEANALAAGIRCIDPGTFTTWLDGAWEGELTCTDDDELAGYDGSGTAWISAHSTDGTHTLRIESTGSARFVVWASWATRIEPEEPSQAQTAALEDGVVTREEYLASFDRFAACMDEGGWPIVGVDRSSTVLDYSTRSEAYESGLDATCYELEFQDVDVAWQIANEDTSASTELLRQCLRDNGIEPAYTTVDVVAQLEEAGIDLATC